MMRYLLLALLIVASLPLGSFAGYREEFEREFLSKPWAGEQVEEDACIACHVPEGLVGMGSVAVPVGPFKVSAVLECSSQRSVEKVPAVEYTAAISFSCCCATVPSGWISW